MNSELYLLLFLLFFLIMCDGYTRLWFFFSSPSISLKKSNSPRTGGPKQEEKVERVSVSQAAALHGAAAVQWSAAAWQEQPQLRIWSKPRPFQRHTLTAPLPWV